VARGAASHQALVTDALEEAGREAAVVLILTSREHLPGRKAGRGSDIYTNAPEALPINRQVGSLSSE
jgi:hypothetical protein